MLKAIVDSLEGMPQELTGHYTQTEDGKFRLDIEGGYKTTEEISGLSSALGKERVRADTAEKKLKEFEGFDPKELGNLKTENERLRASQDSAAKDREAQLAAALKPVSDDRDKYKQLYEAEKAGRESMMLDNAVARCKIFEQVKDPIYRDNLQRVVRPLLKVQDGKVVGFRQDGSQVFDTNGQPPSADEIVELTAKSLPDYMKYVNDTNPGGSGAQPPSGGANPKPVGVPSSLKECKTQAEKIAYLERLGKVAS